MMYSVSAVRLERVIVVSVPAMASIFVFICTGKQLSLHPVIEALRTYRKEEGERGRWKDEGRGGKEIGVNRNIQHPHKVYTAH